MTVDEPYVAQTRVNLVECILYNYIASQGEKKFILSFFLKIFYLLHYRLRGPKTRKIGYGGGGGSYRH